MQAPAVRLAVRRSWAMAAIPSDEEQLDAFVAWLQIIGSEFHPVKGAADLCDGVVLWNVLANVYVFVDAGRS